MLVLAQRSDEQRLARQARELHRRDRPAARRLLERVARVHHLARARHVLHARELHPLHVAHHRHSQPLVRTGTSLTHPPHTPPPGHRMRRHDPLVLVEEPAPHVVQLALNRPEQLNAMNAELCEALHEELRRIALSARAER